MHEISLPDDFDSSTFARLRHALMPTLFDGSERVPFVVTAPGVASWRISNDVDDALYLSLLSGVSGVKRRVSPILAVVLFISVVVGFFAIRSLETVGVRDAVLSVSSLALFCMIYLCREIVVRKRAYEERVRLGYSFADMCGTVLAISDEAIVVVIGASGPFTRTTLKPSMFSDLVSLPRSNGCFSIVLKPVSAVGNDIVIENLQSSENLRNAIAAFRQSVLGAAKLREAC
jgi:hypothetical protein